LKRVVEAATARKEAKAEKDKKAGIEPSSDPANYDKDPAEKHAVPPETVRDWRVFPHNPSFISQPVLSEPFREAIWKKIMLEGQSVREVSAGMRVEMSRVGAVVRLKEIEKEWQRIVSLRNPFPFPSTTIMMIL